MTSAGSSSVDRGNNEDRWEAFTRIARRFYEAENYHAQERGYKLVIGERLVETRKAFHSDGEDWIDRLKRAFGPPNNLTSWRIHGPFVTWCREDPDRAAAAFQMLWDPARSVKNRIDDFLAGVTTPNLKIPLTEASFLHMAMDPIMYPIFRATASADAMRLTWYATTPPAGENSVGGRYEHYLGFLDRILAETSRRGLELRDRLDAQSVVWMITKYPPEHQELLPGWSLEERQTFAAFLGMQLPSEKSSQPPVSDDHSRPTPPGPDENPPADTEEYEAPNFDVIRSRIAKHGMRLTVQTLRRYHLSLATRGFVILAGVSGTGKTWLAEAYAESVGARYLIVPIAPNWTTNEDLLGFFNPLTSEYHDTPVSRFIREAESSYLATIDSGQTPQPYHLILDEMNLARVEYYFAGFLSAMEVRARHGTATLNLGPHDTVTLPPNLFVAGTVNIDETTHGFADKVYDRAQLVELNLQREEIAAHLAGRGYQDALLTIWDAVSTVGPFAFRVLDDMAAYIDAAEAIGIPWEVALDEQIAQKVLPKLNGAKPGMETALEQIVVTASDRYPLTHDRARTMLEGFYLHGFVSYFT